MEFLNTIEIVNYLADRFGYKNYLEIGTHQCNTINRVEMPFKRGVDIDRNVNRCDNPSHMTSDKYFETDVFADIENNGKFDIVFIDGLHHSDQVDKDFENSLKYLSDDGIILMDDVTPPEEEWQIIPRARWGGWTGDCWKSFLKLRCSREDLFMCTVMFEDSWSGNGIIWKGTQELYNDTLKDEFLEYSHFDENRKEILNLITKEELIEILNRRKI